MWTEDVKTPPIIGNTIGFITSLPTPELQRMGIRPKSITQTVINQASGEAESLLNSINSKKKQLQLFEENIIPALKKNYQVMQLAYEQNTGELFELFDAWQTLNMTQFDYLDQLQQLLNLQVQMDKILEIK